MSHWQRAHHNYRYETESNGHYRYPEYDDYSMYEDERYPTNQQHRLIYPKLHLTTNQQKFQDSMEKHAMTICHGAAGTGKTYLSCSFAANALKRGEYDKILITRPNVSMDGALGFLPGGIDEKMYPFIAPMLDVLREYFSFRTMKRLRDEGRIEIVPLPFIQGRTFKNSIIVADEMQNSTANQMYMLMTRLGMGSKMVITGDLNQKHSDSEKRNGLRDLIEKMKVKYPGKKRKDIDVNIVSLHAQDVRRHPLVAQITTIYGRSEDSKDNKLQKAERANSDSIQSKQKSSTIQITRSVSKLQQQLEELTKRVNELDVMRKLIEQVGDSNHPQN